MLCVELGFIRETAEDSSEAAAVPENSRNPMAVHALTGSYSIWNMRLGIYRNRGRFL